MSLSMQAKMLRVLQDRKVRRLGGSQSMHIDMRVIAASNIALKDMVAEGKMRPDFYYRINVVPIRLVPLRKRSLDIPLLVQNFLHQHPVARSKKIVDVSKKVMGQLVEYSWPGNIRELQNTLECAILLAPGRIIEEVKLPQMEPKLDLEKSKIASATLRQWLREKERDYLAQKLADLGGNIGLTAKMCRIGVRTLSRKLRLYGLDKNLFKDRVANNEPFRPNQDWSVSAPANNDE
jgi:transcriptional regulator with PAS, ATPase and Fis domain